MGHPMAAAAALAVQDVIRRDGLLDNVKTRAAISCAGCASVSATIIMSAISAAAASSPGSNLSLIAPARSRSIRASSCNAAIKREAIARGLMVYPMGGTIDGLRGDHVLLAPPFIIDAASIDVIVERLGEAVDAAIGKLAVRSAAWNKQTDRPYGIRVGRKRHYKEEPDE